MTTTISASAPSLDPSSIDEIVECFYRTGIALVPNVLSADECRVLREGVDDLLTEQIERGTDGGFWQTSIVRETAQKRTPFRDLLVREPLLSLAKAVLGEDCRYAASNAIRNSPGNAIDRWHIDFLDHVEVPLPDEIPHHDFRMRMPVNWMVIQVPLTDIEAPEFGPTQFVPRSHYSGRIVPAGSNEPKFLGHGPEYLLCRAGDIYLFNNQMWHRGSPNTSERTRYLVQCEYCRDWLVSNFGNIHKLDTDILTGADDNTRRLFMREGAI